MNLATETKLWWGWLKQHLCMAVCPWNIEKWPCAQCSDCISFVLGLQILLSDMGGSCSVLKSHTVYYILQTESFDLAQSLNCQLTTAEWRTINRANVLLESNVMKQAHFIVNFIPHDRHLVNKIPTKIQSGICFNAFTKCTICKNDMKILVENTRCFMIIPPLFTDASFNTC